MRVKNEMLEIIKDKVELQKSVEYQRVSAEIEDIMNVPGIGKSKYEQIKDYIEVD